MKDDQRKGEGLRSDCVSRIGLKIILLSCLVQLEGVLFELLELDLLISAQPLNKILIHVFPKVIWGRSGEFLEIHCPLCHEGLCLGRDPRESADHPEGEEKRRGFEREDGLGQGLPFCGPETRSGQKSWRRA